MKKALLFPILALSFNINAQNDFSKSSMLQPSLFSYNNVNYISKPSETYSRKNIGEVLKHQGQKQDDLMQINDSIYQWKWHEASIGWEISSKIVNIIYDANCNMTSYKIQARVDNTWVDASVYTATYDANNNLTSKLVQEWDDSNWVNYEQIDYTYDVNNNLTSWISYSGWNSDLWQIYRKNSFTYDANNNRTSELWQQSDSGTWINLFNILYAYNVNNNVASIRTQLWDSAWLDRRQEIFTYDSNNNLLHYLHQFWNDSVWANSGQITYSYNNSNQLTSKVSQDCWTSGLWMNIDSISYSYDENNNLSVELTDKWISDNSYDYEWIDFEKILYTYDDTNKLTNYLLQRWVDNNWKDYQQSSTGFDVNNFIISETNKTWGVMETSFGGDSTYYYFHTGTAGINDQTTPFQSLSIYPNPSSGQFTISSKSEITSVEIYNLVGERIYSDYNLNCKTIKAFDLSGSPKGIYFVKVQNGTKGINKKIVIH